VAKIPSPAGLPIGAHSSAVKFNLTPFQHVIALSGLCQVAQELPVKAGQFISATHIREPPDRLFAASTT
jgi:hypothetical protein